MIKAQTLLRIHDLIDNHERFISNDFQIECKGVQLIIIYNYENQYTFKVSFPTATSTVSDGKTERNIMSFTKIIESTKEDYVFTGNMKPGQVALDENFRIQGLNLLFEKLTVWLDSLWDEIVYKPQLRVLLESEKEIEKIKKKFKEVEDEKFSKEEAEKLIEKLNKLEQQFVDQSEITSHNEKELKEALIELHNEIETLKLLLYTLKKPGWFKSFGTRIFKWYTKEDNRKMLKDGLELMKPFLPDGTKDVIE